MIKSKIFQFTSQACLLACLFLSAPQGFAGTINATTNGGVAVTLTFETDPVFSTITSAVFCLVDTSLPARAVQSAILWKPEHAHGSVPTMIIASDTHCVEIGHIVFRASGHWEVRVALDDGDYVAIPVDID